MPFYFKLNREGLGISWRGYTFAVSWLPFNKFAFAYLSGKFGFGYSQYTGWTKWRAR